VHALAAASGASSEHTRTAARVRAEKPWIIIAEPAPWARSEQTPLPASQALAVLDAQPDGMDLCRQAKVPAHRPGASYPPRRSMWD
jgi:hypothetical protein